MLLKLLSIYFLFASTFAWLAPERCSQSKHRSLALTADTISVKSVPDIEKIAAKQHEELLKKYKNRQFASMPIKATTGVHSYHPREFEMHAPFNCTFYTYDPELLSSVNCINATCKLFHTVSTVDSYTASEGYNWGVKGSAKFSLFGWFEVGGEASTSGSYTCTYTKGRTTTDTVECSDSSSQNGQLQLFNVKSDMICDFGQIKLTRNYRQKKDGSFGPGDINYFTYDEVIELKNSAQVVVKSRGWFMMDTNKISDLLFHKFLDKFPLFNPYTDLILVIPGFVSVEILYFKPVSNVQQYRRIIPFTNEAGNCVYQYACIRVPGNTDKYFMVPV